MRGSCTDIKGYEKSLWAVLQAATVQEDEGVLSGYADILEHGGHLGLADHLDLALAVADLVGLGGDADLPLVFLLHLVVLDVLHVIPGDVVVGRLAHQQHDASHVDPSGAPDVPQGFLLQHLDGLLLGLVNLLHEEAIAQDHHGGLLAGRGFQSLETASV